MRCESVGREPRMYARGAHVVVLATDEIGTISALVESPIGGPPTYRVVCYPDTLHVCGAADIAPLDDDADDLSVVERHVARTEGGAS